MINSKFSEPLRILIVEDSPTQRAQLQHLLEQNSFNVSVAENGKAALALVDKEIPDLVISDIVMPEMNGFDFCRHFKFSESRSHIPVILLTSLSNAEDVLEGLACGADNFITKPFKPAILIAQIHSALANKRNTQGERVRISTEISFMGRKRLVTAEHQQMLTLLLSTYEAAVLRNEELANTQEDLRIINEQLEELVEQRTLALKQSEEKYLDLYDNAPSMFMSVEPHGGRVIECNVTLLEHTGFTRAEVIGQHFTERYHPDSLQKVEEDFRMFMMTGLVSNSELYLRTKSGGKITVLTNSTAVRNENGEILHSRTVLQDISDLKKIQEELRQSKEKAEESDRLKSAFLANMSHEIRTPMNGILGFTQLLKDPDLNNSTRREFIKHIDRSTNRLLKIITDIVDISRIESGVDSLEKSEIDLIWLLDDSQALFQPQAKGKNLDIKFYCNIAPAASKVITDGGKLKQIVNNLISNAIKFTEQGNIEVTASIENDSLNLTVKDTGIGIDPEMHEVIFDRFRQVEIGHSRKYEGAGLGLSIARSYARLLKGEISLESSIGKGSIFKLILPVTPVNEPVLSLRPAVTETPPAKPGWDGKTLLLAEDEDENASFVKAVLKSTGIKVIQAFNGKEAVELCLSNAEISLVLMDIRMPELDGLSATRQIKSVRKDLPVIATTAYALGSDRQKCFEAGCDEYLPKPFGKQQILEIMRKYLSA
ncbi:MAG: response regulator [Bacteroidales bacterium]